jgi:hypothetical protein
MWDGFIRIRIRISGARKNVLDFSVMDAAPGSQLKQKLA